MINMILEVVKSFDLTNIMLAATIIGPIGYLFYQKYNTISNFAKEKLISLESLQKQLTGMTLLLEEEKKKNLAILKSNDNILKFVDNLIVKEINTAYELRIKIDYIKSDTSLITDKMFNGYVKTSAETLITSLSSNIKNTLLWYFNDEHAINNYILTEVYRKMLTIINTINSITMKSNGNKKYTENILMHTNILNNMIKDEDQVVLKGEKK